MLKISHASTALALATLPMMSSGCKTPATSSETKDAGIAAYQAAVSATRDDCKEIRDGIAKGEDWTSPSGLVTVTIKDKDANGKPLVDRETNYPTPIKFVKVKPSPKGEYICSAPIVMDKPYTTLYGDAPNGADGLPGRVKIKLAKQARAPQIIMGQMQSTDSNDRIETVRMLEVDNFELDGNRFEQIDPVQLRVLENEFLTNRQLQEVWAYGIKQAENDRRNRSDYNFEQPGSLDELNKKVQASLDDGGTDVLTYQLIEADLFKVLRTLRRAAKDKDPNSDEVKRFETIRVYEDIFRQSLQDFECWMRTCGKLSEHEINPKKNTTYASSIIRNNGVTLRGALFSTVKNVKALRQLSGGMVTEKHCKGLVVEDFESTQNFFDGFAGYQTGVEYPVTMKRADRGPKMPENDMDCTKDYERKDANGNFFDSTKDISTFTRMNLHDNLHAGISLDINFSCNKIIDSDIINNGHGGIFARDSVKNIFENLCIIGNHEDGAFLAMANPNPPQPASYYQFINPYVAANDGFGLWIADSVCEGTLIKGGQIAKNLSDEAVHAPGVHVEMQSVADGKNADVYPLKTKTSCLGGAK